MKSDSNGTENRGRTSLIQIWKLVLFGLHFKSCEMTNKCVIQTSEHVPGLQLLIKLHFFNFGLACEWAHHCAYNRRSPVVCIAKRAVTIATDFLSSRMCARTIAECRFSHRHTAFPSLPSKLGHDKARWWLSILCLHAQSLELLLYPEYQVSVPVQLVFVHLEPIYCCKSLVASYRHIWSSKTYLDLCLNIERVNSLGISIILFPWLNGW